MIVLYIFLGLLLTLLALLALILFLNVHLVFHYENGAKIYLRILFIKMDAKKIASRLSGRKKETKDKKSTPEKKPTEKNSKRKRASISDFLEFICLIIRIVKRAVKDLFKHLHIRLREMEICFGTDEADKTALVYGATAQAANVLFALLQRFSDFQWNNDKLLLAPDFTGENSRYKAHLDLWIKPIFLLTIALHAITTYLEGKGKNHE